MDCAPNFLFFELLQLHLKIFFFLLGRLKKKINLRIQSTMQPFTFKPFCSVACFYFAFFWTLLTVYTKTSFIKFPILLTSESNIHPSSTLL